MPSSCSRISAAASRCLQDPLPRLVVGDQLADVVALGRGVLGVGADVQVEPGAVLQEDVRGAAPVHDPAEQVPGHLVGRQAPLPAERARDAVLVLEAEDPPLHADEPRPLPGDEMRPEGLAQPAGVGLDLGVVEAAELPPLRRACGPGRRLDVCSAGDLARARARCRAPSTPVRTAVARSQPSW